MNWREYRMEDNEMNVGNWSPSRAAIQSSIFTLGVGIGLILAATPVLAQSLGEGVIGTSSMHIEAVELIGFLAILACMPAVVLVFASTLRILLTLTRKHLGMRRDTTYEQGVRTWQVSDTDVSFPVHLALPARLAEEMDADLVDLPSVTPWGSPTENSFPHFPAV